MRHDKYHLEQLILQGNEDGRRGPDRRRNSWMQNLRKWFGLSYIQWFRQDGNKIRIAILIANIQKKHLMSKTTDVRPYWLSHVTLAFYLNEEPLESKDMNG